MGMRGRAGANMDETRSLTFMTPHLLYRFSTVVALVQELPDDIRKSFFGVTEESLEVVLPGERSMARGFLEAGRRDGRRGHDTRDEGDEREEDMWERKKDG